MSSLIMNCFSVPRKWCIHALQKWNVIVTEFSQLFRIPWILLMNSSLQFCPYLLNDKSQFWAGQSFNTVKRSYSATLVSQVIYGIELYHVESCLHPSQVDMLSTIKATVDFVSPPKYQILVSKLQFSSYVMDFAFLDF